MTDAIRYDFAGLEQGHGDLMGSASGFTDLKEAWKSVVSATIMTWLSQDGVTFGDVNAIFDQAATTTTEFQIRLAAAVQACNMNAQETLAYCNGIVGG